MKCDICGSEETFVRDCKYTFSIQGKEVTIICQKRFCSDCNNEVVDEDLEKETLKKAVRKYNELYGLSKSKILALRRSYHLSQEQFSKAIGCAKKTLVSYEKGTSTPNYNYAIILNTLIYKPRVLIYMIDANKDNYTKKEYNEIMNRIQMNKNKEEK